MELNRSEHEHLHDRGTDRLLASIAAFDSADQALPLVVGRDGHPIVSAVADAQDKADRYGKLHADLSRTPRRSKRSSELARSLQTVYLRLVNMLRAGWGGHKLDALNARIKSLHAAEADNCLCGRCGTEMVEVFEREAGIIDMGHKCPDPDCGYCEIEVTTAEKYDADRRAEDAIEDDRARRNGGGM